MIGDLRGRTDPAEVLKCPEYLDAHALYKKLRNQIKNAILKRKREDADLDYIIKSALIMLLADIIGRTTDSKEKRGNNLLQIFEGTAHALDNATAIGMIK